MRTNRYSVMSHVDLFHMCIIGRQTEIEKQSYPKEVRGREVGAESSWITRSLKVLSNGG
jgi:hypothetical protein